MRTGFKLLAAVALCALCPGLYAQEAPPAEVDPDAELIPSQYEAQLDAAVDKALKYLATQQDPKGFFRSKIGDNTGVTSLCLMAFMARGHSPGCGPYGELLNKGVAYVADTIREDGYLLGDNRSNAMYAHTIATLLLSEANGMVNPDIQARIDKALPRALQLILSAQKVPKPEQHSGGWRYDSGSRDSDLSCSGWPILGLRSAQNNGAVVPADAIEDGVNYVLKMGHNGGFRYQPGQGPVVSMTGVGVLVLELTGHHGQDVTTEGGDFIMEHMQNHLRGGFWHYGMYYASQATWQLGGDYWRKYAEYMYGRMLAEQKEDGSWDANSQGTSRAGPACSTAFIVLALSVPYCQLPIYQR